MSTVFTIFVIGVFCNLALALFGLILADRRARKSRARLERAACKAPRQSGPQVTGKKRSTARQDTLIGRCLGGVEQQLSQTGLRLGTGELLLQMGLGVLGIYAGSVLVLSTHPVVALPFALLLPPLAAALFLRFAKQRYMKAFSDGLPEALDIFARGLRAGRPVADSMAIVVESSKGPVLREFSRCCDELHMGTDLAVTLNRLSTRLPTPEVCFFAVATALQAETGGNLIETMESLASQLRDRRKLRKKARALSSEARVSAIILAALPFAVAGLIALLNGAYLEPLYADPRGRVMAMIALGSISAGILLMARMGKINV